MSEFSDKPFVAGILTGLRAFRVDGLGRLTGITYKDVWAPGENQSVCHKGSNELSVAMRMTAQLTALTYSEPRGFGRGGRKTQSVPKIPTPREKAAAMVGEAHSLASVTCQCGFYAYFDGGNDYLMDPGYNARGGYAYGGIIIGPSAPDNAPRVGAVVNGWGTVTIGSRGFRAERAEVVALITPKSQQARHEVAFTKVRRNYPDVQVFDTEQEAVRAFPLTDAAPYSPETDPEFWTRSAS